jgi:hypothetical protein
MERWNKKKAARHEGTLERRGEEGRKGKGRGYSVAAGASGDPRSTDHW